MRLLVFDIAAIAGNEVQRDGKGKDGADGSSEKSKNEAGLDDLAAAVRHVDRMKCDVDFVDEQKAYRSEMKAAASAVRSCFIMVDILGAGQRLRVS